MKEQPSIWEKMEPLINQLCEEHAAQVTRERDAALAATARERDALRARVERMRAAAQALVSTIEYIHADPLYQSELSALKQALADAPLSMSGASERIHAADGTLSVQSKVGLNAVPDSNASPPAVEHYITSEGGKMRVEGPKPAIGH